MIPLAKAVSTRKVDRGIAICGGGVGAQNSKLMSDSVDGCGKSITWKKEKETHEE